MKYKFIALANPAEGKDEEYEVWANTQHVPDVLANPGFVSAQRFKYCDVKSTGLPLRWKTATIYEVETDDPEAFFATMFAASQQGRIPMSDCFDMSSAFVGLFEPTTGTILPRR
jgi:hypothetical protein